MYPFHKSMIISSYSFFKHSIVHIIDNSIDERLAGFATKIEVTINEDGSVTVQDDGREASENHEYHNYPNQGRGKPNVAIVKQVSGQGAMYDNLLFPTEPSGMQEGESIIDMDNFPVLLTPNEYRDGAIHAMV